MISRLYTIIKREKIKQPQKPGIVLLLERIRIVIGSLLQEKAMKLAKDSTFTDKEDVMMCSLLPKNVLNAIIEKITPETVLDVGCGTGQSLQYFLSHGVDAVGVENSRFAIDSSPVKDKIIRHDLRKELLLGKKFDLVWCFEVIEHIHPKFETNFLRTLTHHSNRIVLSAARPGQGGRGHFNEQEPAYWIKKFKDLGYEMEQSFTAQLRQLGDTHAENILCFRKKN